VPGELRTGDILLLHFQALRPRPKEKFAVVCSIDPSPMLLLINSEINLFIAHSEELRAHHLPIMKADHKFLDDDSFVECTSPPFGYDIAELVEAIAEKPHRHKGTITDALRTQMIEVIEASRLWPKKKATAMCDGLRSRTVYSFE
jgi:hypothetical protein